MPQVVVTEVKPGSVGELMENLSLLTTEFTAVTLFLERPKDAFVVVGADLAQLTYTRGDRPAPVDQCLHSGIFRVKIPSLNVILLYSVPQ